MLSWSFNFFYDWLFWLSFLAVAGAAWIFAPASKWRRWFMGVASSLMLLALPRFGLRDLGLVLGLSILTFFIGSVLTRGTFSAGVPRRRSVAAIGIVTVLGFLAFFKYRFVQGLFLTGRAPGEGATTGLIGLIGVSYFSFRMIHFLIESYRKKIDNPDLLTYIDYIVFFPAFISGPINRYSHFATQLHSATGPRRTADLKAGGERIVHGLFKKLVLAQLIYPHVLPTQPQALAEMGPSEALIGLYAYAFYFYFDFSGYTDLAIGCARLIGIELPENFSNPFLKRNIRELWTNWHMSLTSWLVDYIYWPIVRKFRSAEIFRRHPILLSNLGMVLTFIACGMWHGETVNFLLWGAYHGIGISILTVYQREKRKRKSVFLQRYFRSRTCAVMGVLLTFNFFALGLSLFILDWGRFLILAKAVLTGS